MTEENWKDAASVYDFSCNDIKGNPISFRDYEGHVLLIVNVASRCGYTSKNYKELVRLDETYNGSKGLRILAFPCNQFGKQEPGSNETICKYVEKKKVKFPVFEKVNVNGPNAHPLWKYLKEKVSGPKGERNTGVNTTLAECIVPDKLNGLVPRVDILIFLNQNFPYWNFINK